MSFSSVFDASLTRDLLERRSRSTADMVRDAVARKLSTLDDAATLLAPAAGDLLEDLAREAHRSTVERFGKTISLYAPLYL